MDGTQQRIHEFSLLFRIALFRHPILRRTIPCVDDGLRCSTLVQRMSPRGEDVPVLLRCMSLKRRPWRHGVQMRIPRKLL